VSPVVFIVAVALRENAPGHATFAFRRATLEDIQQQIKKSRRRFLTTDFTDDTNEGGSILIRAIRVIRG
jgi:lipopolysaccharide/colanic/teichoic acid biosynthesis glycosyltransferase